MGSDQVVGLENVPVKQFNSAPELCLYLIMCLPQEKDRILRIGDFCKLYEITEKKMLQSLPYGQVYEGKAKG